MFNDKSGKGDLIVPDCKGSLAEAKRCLHPNHDLLLVGYTCQLDVINVGSLEKQFTTGCTTMLFEIGIIGV